MAQSTRMFRPLMLALLIAAPVAAEEPLWTEGSAKSTANAPINLQAFVRLARTLGPAVVNVIAISSPDGAAEDHTAADSDNTGDVERDRTRRYASCHPRRR